MDENIEVTNAKELVKNSSSRKQRKEAKRIIYEQIKACQKEMNQEDLKPEEVQRLSQAMKGLVECYEILDKPKELPRWVDTGIKIGATVLTIVGTAVVKEKLLNSGSLDKSTEGIFNSSTKLLG